MFRATAFVLSLLLSSSQSTKIHHSMTNDELRLVFQMPRAQIPDYEAVPISHTFHKRSTDVTRIIKLKTFGRDVQLYLNPTEGLLAGENTPVWTVTPDELSQHGLRYEELRDAFSEVGRAYQDSASNSAVVIQKAADGKVQVFGKILTDYVIHPLPLRVANILRQRRSLNASDPSDDEFILSDYHVIYRQPESTEAEIQNEIRVVERDHSHSRRLKRSIPDVIFPELLIVMDYGLYDTLGKSHKSAITYLLSFWNAVDLRYRTLSEPQIRLYLSGFIISVREGGTPYLENYRRADTELDSDQALEGMSKYFYEETRFPFQIYDVAVALTNLDMCNMIGSYVCDTSTLGYAYEAGACNRSSIDRNTEAVGIVEDNGGYSAILPATHELAHLLGVPHDGSMNTLDCPGYDGYIMTGAVTFGELNFHWSNCSRNAFREFFNSQDATCLYNRPEEHKPLSRLLPGKLKTLDEQCERVYGTKACYYDERVCIKLECFVPKGSGYCKAVAAAAEGSYCGQGMHCISGKCLAENATTIPELVVTPRPKLPIFNRPFFQPSTWESPPKSPMTTS